STHSSGVSPSASTDLTAPFTLMSYGIYPSLVGDRYLWSAVTGCRSRTRSRDPCAAGDTRLLDIIMPNEHRSRLVKKCAEPREICIVVLPAPGRVKQCSQNGRRDGDRDHQDGEPFHGGVLSRSVRSANARQGRAGYCYRQ